MSSTSPLLSAETLNLGDRVVYLTESGSAEPGCVRWIGKLPVHGSGVKAWVGVEFDNPVGQDAVTASGRLLFSTKPKRGGLVRIEELVKCDDFFKIPEEEEEPEEEVEEPKKEDFILPADARYGPDCDSINEGFLSESSLSLSGQLFSAVSGGSSGSSERRRMRKEGKPSPETPRSGILRRRSGDDITNNTVLRTNSSNPSLLQLSSNNDNTPPASPALSLDRSPPNLPPTQSRGPGRNGELLEVGCLVEVVGWFKDVFYGVVRWIGYIEDDRDLEGQLMTGLEMEEEDERFSDGCFSGRRYFYCAAQRALFLPLAKCQRDRRFSSSSSPRPHMNLNLEADCVVPGSIPPLQTFDRLCGRYRGIQGHLNSCYLDATLFAMFTYSCVFDSVLYRPPKSCDIAEYPELQAILREEIVNPLRKFCYVKANHVMRLRYMLDKCSNVEGLVSEEKDPEEFLQSLLSETLQAEPLIRLSTGQEAFMYQLVVEKDERLALPTVQQLFDQSFLSSNLKFREVPPCLIIQMPRCGPSFKMYARIQPSMALDITDVLLDTPRSCHCCGALAEVECPDCYDVNEGLESTAFCRSCLGKVHSHRKRLDHETRPLSISPEAREYFSPHVFFGGQAGGHVARQHQNGQRFSNFGPSSPGYAPPSPPRVLMELFAVVCIQTSHYVAFVKAGSGAEAPWCFFDSMADRSGEDDGYNIPEVVPCPGLHRWLSEERIPEVLGVKDEKLLPEYARRLLCDAYLCFYQSHDALMYR